MERRSSHILAGSFLVAALLWLSVTLGEVATARFTVPVTVGTLPEHLAIDSRLPATIDVDLEGPGWQLLFLTLSKQLSLELGGATLRSERVVLGNRFLAGALKLPHGVQVRGAWPDTLFVRLDAYASKKVPVRVPFTSLTFREGFGQTGPLRVDPDSVVISGSARALRDIESWPAEARAYNDLSLPITGSLPLVDSLPGIVTASSTSVNVYLPVDQLADVRFTDIPVVVNDIPAGRDVMLAPARVDIVVRGGVNALSTLSSGDFEAFIDYQQLVADTTGGIAPQLRIHSDLQLLRIIPPVVSYTIRK